MSKIEKVRHNDDIIAIIIRKELETDGAMFFTPEDYPFQLGVLTHSKGVNIKPHLHRKISRTIEITQEMLYLAKGKVEIDLYTDDGQKIGTRILTEGDAILFSEGGHGLRILEDTKIIEVKQGPYSGVENEKTFL